MSEQQQQAVRSVRINSSVALVAHDLNLSIFNPPWLLRENILKEQEIDWQESVFSPGLIRIPTRQFELMILPGRIQLRFPAERTDVESDLLRVLGTIVTKLPHTPYSALGFNNDYLIAPDKMEFSTWNQSLFRTTGLCASVDPSARFGAYYSTEFHDFRRRVDCKPIRVRGDLAERAPQFVEDEEVVNIAFNYHADIPAPPIGARILELIGQWSKVRQDADAFVAQLAEHVCAG